MSVVEINTNPINVTVDTNPVIVSIQQVDSNVSTTDGSTVEIVTTPIDVTVNNYLVELDVKDEKPIIHVNNSKGLDGKSAYEIAVDNGFEGTEEEWLISLIGLPGNLAAKAIYQFPAGTYHQVALASLNLVGFNAINFYNQINESISVYYSFNSNYIYVDSNIDLLNHIMVIY